MTICHKRVCITLPARLLNFIESIRNTSNRSKFISNLIAESLEQIRGGFKIMNILSCIHDSKKYRMEFSDSTTGNYVLELCNNCYSGESKEFLIKEEIIQ